MLSLQFIGAAGTVTGSKHALLDDGRVVLIDCGLFQGPKELRLRNWQKLPVAAGSISDVIITHAHVDHTGYLPRLIKEGFQGRVHATPATRDLMGILLPDTGHLQEEEAEYANRKGYSKHHPALPLFTERDARAALSYVEPVEYGAQVDLGRGLSFRFVDAGHILGSGICVLDTAAAGRIVFSGDLGRPDAPIVQDPTQVDEADYIVIESTYGGRVRNPVPVKDDMARIVGQAIGRGGAVVVPAFAVERTQELLYLLGELQDEGSIPVVPIYIDSPMAVDVINVFERYTNLYDEEATEHHRARRTLFGLENVRLARSVDDSKRISKQSGPLIIISSSGMATGGRVLHHLGQRLPDPRSTVLLVGYQAAGTRGRMLQDGVPDVKIHGERVPVRATVETVHGFSGHADSNQLMLWLARFRRRPRRVFVVHGEPESATALVVRIREELGWEAVAPRYLDTFELSKSDMALGQPEGDPSR